MVGQFLERPLDLENYQNEASVEKAILNSKNRDEENLKDEEEDGVNSLLKTVLITLRDRPDIIMAILQGWKNHFVFKYMREWTATIHASILFMKQTRIQKYADVEVHSSCPHVYLYSSFIFCSIFHPFK